MRPQPSGRAVPRNEVRDSRRRLSGPRAVIRPPRPHSADRAIHSGLRSHLRTLETQVARLTAEVSTHSTNPVRLPGSPGVSSYGSWSYGHGLMARGGFGTDAVGQSGAGRRGQTVGPAPVRRTSCAAPSEEDVTEPRAVAEPPELAAEGGSVGAVLGTLHIPHVRPPAARARPSHEALASTAADGRRVLVAVGAGACRNVPEESITPCVRAWSVQDERSRPAPADSGAEVRPDVRVLGRA